jgi:Flp pilus assembly pilin Flp
MFGWFGRFSLHQGLAGTKFLSLRGFGFLQGNPARGVPVLRRRKNDERGAAAVEFALISMVMLFLIIATIQYSIFFWGFQAGANGAREGARRWAVDPCGTGQVTLVRDRIGSAASNTPTVTAVFEKDSGNTGPGKEPGDKVTVTVVFQPQQITGGFVPLPDEITKTSTARVEDTKGCP